MLDRPRYHANVRCKPTGASVLGRATPHVSPRLRAADDVTLKHTITAVSQYPCNHNSNGIVFK